MKVVQTLVPGANVVLDAKTRQLNVIAGPTVQGIVKKVIDQIEKAAPADKQPRLETYPIDESMAAQLTTALRQMVPAAIVTVDATNGKLVAWATPEEQTTIKEAAEKLAPLPTGERSRQFEVYRLTRASPSTILSLLKSLLPNAKMAVDENSRTLVVIAPVGGSEGGTQPSGAVAAGETGAGHARTKVLSSQAARAGQCGDDRRGRGAIVAADPGHVGPHAPAADGRGPSADQERAKQFLDEYDKKTPEPEKSTLVVYPVTGTQHKRFSRCSRTCRGSCRE